MIFLVSPHIVTSQIRPIATFDRELSFMNENCPYMVGNYPADIHSRPSVLHL